MALLSAAVVGVTATIALVVGVAVAAGAVVVDGQALHGPRLALTDPKTNIAFSARRASSTSDVQTWKSSLGRPPLRSG